MEKVMDIKERYLYFPIQVGAEPKYIEIFDSEDQKVFEFKIPNGRVEDNKYPSAFSARVLVDEFVGKALSIKGDFPKEFMDEIKNEALIYEKRGERPAIHFTSDTGWINDPNGLVFDGENYHLYFQYNPFDIAWQNMSWGHAVSKDMLHWKHLDTVLYPDENGTMFSGCGLKNEHKMLGLSEEALLFFYTAAGDNSDWSKGQPFTQRIAYSLDGGKTLKKLEEPYIGKIGKDTRDPKIFWHEETQAYIMVIFVEGNEFAIYRSTNLAEWEETQRFSLEKAWECPDLMRVPTEEGGYQWMFWSADGFYYWGEFNGYNFQTDGVRHEAYCSKIPYAAQTYSGVLDRVISVSWLRLPNNRKNYTGAMGIPREFTCKKTEQGCVLVQNEIRELQQRWKETGQISGNKPYKVVLEFDESKTDGEPISRFLMNGNTVTFDRNAGILTVNEEQTEINLEQFYINFIIDYNILEVNISGGIIGIYDLKEGSNKFTYEIPESAKIQLFEMEV